MRLSSRSLLLLLSCLFGIAANAQTFALPFRPVTAEYSTSLDRIVMIAANPNQLHIFDPATNTDSTVTLPKPPLSLSVSLDGTHAAVGHDALISYVNLSTASLEKTLTATTTVTSLVLGNDWVYILTYNQGTLPIRISTGAASPSFSVYSGSQGRLHPGGKALYTTQDGLGPEHLQDLDVSTGPPTVANQGPYHGDYPVCGGVWFSPDGNRVYTGCAAAYQANPQNVVGFLQRATKADGMYWSSLAGASLIRSLTESATLGKVAAIPTVYAYSSTPQPDNQILLYDSTWLEPAGTYQLPDFTAGGKSYRAHGQKVFFNKASTSLYVVMQADGAAGLLNDFAVLNLSMGTPQPCGATTGAANASSPSTGGTATVAVKADPTCIYQAVSSADWLQIISGGYGSGNGTLTYMVRPNPGSSRTATIVIGAQSFTVTQLATAGPSNQLTPLGYSVAGAAYSKPLDRLVTIAANPNELHIYDPATAADRIVPLPKVPLFVSLSPDGRSAGVGFDGWVSVIDLASAAITTTVQAFTDVHTLVLGNTGYIYVYPQATWGELYSIKLSTGILTDQNAIYTGRYPVLYFDGATFYTEGSKWDISKGAAVSISSNYSSPVAAPFWLTEDGARLLDARGKVYTTSPVASQDLQYNGTFANAPDVRWADESAKLHSTAVIPSAGSNGNASDDTFLQMYGDAYLGYAGKLSLPPFVVDSGSYTGHGRYTFWNNAADKLIVLEQADAAAKLTADYGIDVLSVNIPATGCSFTLATNSASAPKNGGLSLATVSTGATCIWEATSNAPWITVNSGAVYFGAGTVEYGVAANTGVTRTGTITIGGQTLTITQSGTDPTGAALRVTLTHRGSLTQGQSGAIYSIAISNTGTLPATGALTVTENLPPGLTLAGMQGSGWNCALSVCSRNDGLAGLSTLPAITVTVDVAITAAAQVTNQVALAGDGGLSASATDPTVVLAAFTDVLPTDVLLPAINLLREFGITSGCGNLPPTFCPTDNISRGQMAVFVVRSILGGDNFTFTATPFFTDVPAAHPYFKWIQAMRDLGITSGCGSSSKYCPDDSVTRGQMAVFIIRARYGAANSFGYPTPPAFTDVPASHTYFSWIQKMQQLGITSGCGPTKYCPDDSVTRGQMAVFLMRGMFNQLLPVSIPLLGSISPGAVARGQSATLTINGVNTTFADGATQLSAGPGITFTNVVVSSATTLKVQVSVAAGATPGPRSLTAITGSEEATLPNGLVIQ